MARMLDDLLDAARVSSGKIELDQSAVSLSEVLDSAVDACEASMALRRQTLVREDCPGELLLEADRIRLAQVFSNLLLNASKYTHEAGEIRLSCRAAPDLVEISVVDNGTGIAADLLPHVFDLFVQGPRSLARPGGGLGIGLSVVRSLVQMHGGMVTAYSDGPAQGSRFVVRLPRAENVELAAATTLPPQASRTGRVLLIEDNMDASDTLAELLALNGHTVTRALDGPRGLAMALADAYEIVICDIGLPGMDGYEVMRRLRQDKSSGPPPYAIALTGYGAPQDERRAREAGFDNYMVKPVDARRLLATISAHVAAPGN
jgi:CheY-like chemotaxis protein/two-component sensor histidine kinase